MHICLRVVPNLCPVIKVEYGQLLYWLSTEVKSVVFQQKFRLSSQQAGTVNISRGTSSEA